MTSCRLCLTSIPGGQTWTIERRKNGLSGLMEKYLNRNIRRRQWLGDRGHVDDVWKNEPRNLGFVGRHLHQNIRRRDWLGDRGYICIYWMERAWLRVELGC